ncbi:MAG: hypothetical protein AAGE52_24490 [Myxococcota bacterium]
MALRLSLGCLLIAACSVPRSGIGQSDATVGGCTSDGECEDGFECTEDSCDAGTCRNVPQDSSCIDAAGGVCAPESGSRDLRGCVYGACDEATCEETQTNPEFCEVGTCDGDLCRGESTCAPGEVCCGDGTCMACDDNNPCTNDTCTADGCAHTAVAGLLCNDDDACTVGDICNDAGECVGTSCEEMGGDLTCGPTGCVGCVDDDDCADSMTAFGPCMFGAVDTAAVCTGTQSRTITTGTCNADRVCIFTDRPDTRNCNQAAGSNVRCGADELTSFGSCNYTGFCDESATQSRTRTILRCDAATCERRNGSDGRDTRNCNRTRTGMDCDGGTTCPGFGSCMFDSRNSCDETGTQSRTCTDRTCASDSCRSNNRVETRDCSRDTDGDTCNGGTTCGGYGSCMGFSDTCDETGTQTRTCTDRECDSGSCDSSTRTESRNCNRDTDGDTCNGGTTCTNYGACMGFSDTCDETGTQTRTCTDRECGSGTCGSTMRMESRNCNRDTDGTSCGTATACERPDGAPTNTCTGEMNMPECGSGSCSDVKAACDLPNGTDCASGNTCNGAGLCCDGEGNCF